MNLETLQRLVENRARPIMLVFGLVIFAGLLAFIGSMIVAIVAHIEVPL